MSQQTQIRRDTSNNLATVTPAEGEVGFDVTNKRLVIGDGARQGGWETPNLEDIRKQAFTYAVAGGTANALTLTYAPVTLSDAAPQELKFKASLTNTGSATVAIDGRSPITLQKVKGGALANLEAGDIVAGGVYTIVRTGSVYLVTSLGQTANAISGLNLVAIATGGGATYDFTSLPSDYSTFLFVLDNMVTSSTTSSLWLRTRRAGQGAFDSGVSWYVHSGIGYSSPSGMIPATNAAYNRFSGHVMAHGFGLTGLCMISGQITADRSDSSNFGHFTFAGCNKDTTPLDGIRFLTNGYTFTSGTIYAYGYRRTLT